MKRNIVLAVIVIALIFAVYYLDQIGKFNNGQVRDADNQILSNLNLGDLNKIASQGFVISKKNDNYFFANENVKVSKEAVTEFLESLSTIDATRFLSENEYDPKQEANFFDEQPLSLEFSFTKGTLKFILGKKLLYSEEFYLKVIRGNDSKVVVAKDQATPDGFYSEEEKNRNSLRYNRVREVFLTKKDFFTDRKFFESEFKLINISLHGKHNIPFKVNFDSLTTDPATENTISYFKEYFDHYQKELLTLQYTKIFDLNPKSKLGEEIAVLTINGNKIFHLYELFNNEVGYYVVEENSKVIRQIDPAKAFLFQVNRQDFWKISLPTASLEYGKKDELFEISFSSGRKFACKIPQGNFFSVECNPPAVLNQESFSQLFSFLTNRADFVSFDRSSLGKVKFSLKNVDFDIDVYFQDKSLLLVEKNKKYSLHFYVGSDSPIPVNESDYINNEGNL